MVPGWSERDWHALNALRNEWIQSGQRNRHVRRAVTRSRIGVTARLLFISVMGAARRSSIAQRPAVSEVPSSAKAGGRGLRFTQRVMQGGTR